MGEASAEATATHPSFEMTECQLFLWEAEMTFGRLRRKVAAVHRMPFLGTDQIRPDRAPFATQAFGGGIRQPFVSLFSAGASSRTNAFLKCSPIALMAVSRAVVSRSWGSRFRSIYHFAVR